MLWHGAASSERGLGFGCAALMPARLAVLVHAQA